MKVDIIYPEPKKQRQIQQKIINIMKWPFLFSAYICIIINLVTGGKAWSGVVVWSLWFVWTTIVSPSLIEYNRISQFIKFISNSCILLILIDVFLSPGWVIEVVPIILFSGLTVAGILFFTDLERQKQNMLPLLLLAVISFICAVAGISVSHGKELWAIALMGALAFAFLVSCAYVLGSDFIREIKKRFHTK